MRAGRHELATAFDSIRFDSIGRAQYSGRAEHLPPRLLVPMTSPRRVEREEGRGGRGGGRGRESKREGGRERRRGREREREGEGEEEGEGVCVCVCM